MDDLIRFNGQVYEVSPGNPAYLRNVKSGGYVNAITLPQNTLLAAKAEQTEAEEALEAANQLPCDNDEDEAFIVEILQDGKARVATLERMKSEALDPIKSAVKVIESWFKPALVAYAGVERVLKGKMVERRARLEVERRSALAALAVAEAVEEAGEAIEKVAAAQAPTAPKGATISKLWTFELVDLGEVPPEFLMLDSPAVTKAIRDGVREIPGVRIFQKDSVSIRG